MATTLKLRRILGRLCTCSLAEFRVKVGDTVQEGQLVALSDNTGNSTGAHLHWGYYKFPRDRGNGFAGFIDQLPLLTNTPNQPIDNMYKGYDLTNRESMKVAIDVLVRVQAGEFVDKTTYIADTNLLKKELEEANKKIEILQHK